MIDDLDVLRCPVCNGVHVDHVVFNQFWCESCAGPFRMLPNGSTYLLEGDREGVV